MKVWASYARFEADQAKDIYRVREIMNQAQDYFRDSQPDLKEERKMLLETWLEIELQISQRGGSDQSQVDDVRSKLPIKVKRRR